MNAKQTPLIDLLKAVPKTARLLVQENASTRSIPVGKLCADAVEELERAQAFASENALRAALAEPPRKSTCVYPQCVSTTRTQCEAWALGACEERQDEASKRLAWTEDYGERS